MGSTSTNSSRSVRIAFLAGALVCLAGLAAQPPCARSQEPQRAVAVLLGDRVQILSPAGAVVGELALPGTGLQIAAQATSDLLIVLGASSLYVVSLTGSSESVRTVSFPDDMHPCLHEELGRFVQDRADFGFLDCSEQTVCLEVQDGPWGQFLASGELRVDPVASDTTFHLTTAEGSCGNHFDDNTLCQASDCAPIRVAPEPQTLDLDFDGSRCAIGITTAPSPVEIELQMEPPPLPDFQFFALEDCRLAIEGVAPSGRYVAVSYQPISAEQVYRRVVVVDLHERALVVGIELEVEHMSAIGGLPRGPSPFVRWSREWDILLADRHLVRFGETLSITELGGDAVLLR